MQIAVCDDEKSIGLILEEKIKKLLPDAVIEKYLSGDELIASGCEPDILFLDIQMPGMDGMETARLLRQKNERMVLIFVTAVEEYVFQAFDVAAFHYLVKPFSDEKFEMLNNLKEFNYKNIYLSEKTLGSVDYFELVLNKLFWFLSRMNFRDDDMKKICPVLADDFNKWLKEFFSLDINHRDIIISDNEFLQAVIYYIAGMTDNFAIEMYNKIIKISKVTVME